MNDTHQYGGEHHALSVIDRIGTRVEREIHDFDLARSWDASFLRAVLPVMDAVVRYFDAVVEDFHHVPGGPVLLVGNHSGGMYMPDFWVLLRRWIAERGLDDPLYSLGYDLMFSLPGVGPLARRFGSVPGSQENGSRLLAAGHSIVVYPGGDEDDYRPWTQRRRVDLHGRMGFVRLALRHQVPVVPIVSHGSHDALIVMSRGDAIARLLRLDRVRVNILPLVVALPLPLPAQVTVRVCEALDWTAHPPEDADDPGVVRHCYEETLGRMQSTLDELAAGHPHPLLSGVRDPFRLRRRRASSSGESA